MSFNSSMTDAALLASLGERLARVRLDANLTQSELARRAGIGLRTLQRLESGAVAAQLTVFLRVCRALDLIDRFDLLLPDERPGPLELLERHGAQRQRASSRVAETSSSTEWRWADGS
jgi:transcriptional regulator with XRE-family HTH domain